jgi:hypothetical protein
MSALIAVASFRNHVEADLACSALQAAGLQSTTTADDVGGLRPHLASPGGRGVVVWVREEDAEEARDVLGTTARSTSDG